MENRAGRTIIRLHTSFRQQSRDECLGNCHVDAGRFALATSGSSRFKTAPALDFYRQIGRLTHDGLG
ncbi:MAG: hypothetical protein AB7Q45_22955 [Planctomycetaceae bacterium]